MEVERMVYFKISIFKTCWMQFRCERRMSGRQITVVQTSLGKHASHESQGASPGSASDPAFSFMHSGGRR